MGLSVELLNVTGVNLVLSVLVELAAEALLIVISETLHVLGNVTTENVAAESLGVELLSLDVVTGETALGVRNEDTTVGGTLHGTEDTGTSGGTGKTNVEEGLEGAASTLLGLGSLSERELSIGLLNTGEILVKAELLESAAGKEETGSVGGGPVGQTVGDAIALELVGVGAGEDLVTGDFRVDDLGDDVAVGEANDQAVLGSVVLVLGLGDQALTSIVVGLSLSATAVLGLVATVECISRQFSHREFAIILPVVRAGLDGLRVRGLPDSHSSQQFALQKNPHPKHLAKTRKAREKLMFSEDRPETMQQCCHFSRMAVLTHHFDCWAGCRRLPCREIKKFCGTIYLCNLWTVA